VRVHKGRGIDHPSALPPSPTVKSHFPIDHVCHVAATTEELHHILAGACHLRPADYSVGAVKFLDKMELANELIPAILELAPAGQTLITSVLPEEFSGG
jgi:hypothetical protein